MNFLNLLASLPSASIVESSSISLNFIGKYIEWLINVTGSTGLGIILFTLTLRLIVLPFDIYSKVKSKKNAIKMEQMRPELERLQKQYANDKNLYNQKMLALQKKNGYSAFSGCLPMILSLVIFFVAIDAFRMYSAFAMKEEYNDLVKAYNQTLQSVTIEGENKDLFTVVNTEDNKNFTIQLNKDYLYENISNVSPTYADIRDAVIYNGGKYSLNVDGNNNFTAAGNAFLDKIYEKMSEEDRTHIVKEEGSSVYTFVYKTTDHAKEREEIANVIIEVVSDCYFKEITVTEINQAVKEAYESDKIKKSGFLWVKNIWMPDVSYEHPIVGDVKTFQSKISANARKSCSCDVITIDIDTAQYEIVTAGLIEQKETPNGYFIMVALSILSTFLSQFFMQKMQKSQIELQTVDGQSAMTQKMMMWMMPIMFGFFAFSYSTAFSIYMTLSSVITTVSNLIINYILEKKYAVVSVAPVVRSKNDIRKIEKEVAAKKAEEKKKEEQKRAKKEERKKGSEKK